MRSLTHGFHVQCIPTLSRVFQREQDAANRISVAGDASPTVADAGTSSNSLLKPLTPSFWKTDGDLSRGLQWLCLYTTSGVDVPLHIYDQCASMVSEQGGTLVDSILLVKTMLSFAWLRSLGRHDLHKAIALLHSCKMNEVLEKLKAGSALEEV